MTKFHEVCIRTMPFKVYTSVFPRFDLVTHFQPNTTQFQIWPRFNDEKKISDIVS